MNAIRRVCALWTVALCTATLAFVTTTHAADGPPVFHHGIAGDTLAVDDTHLWFADETYRLVKLKRSGGAPEVVAQLAGEAQKIALADGFIYVMVSSDAWSRTLYRVSKRGGVPAQIESGVESFAVTQAGVAILTSYSLVRLAHTGEVLGSTPAKTPEQLPNLRDAAILIAPR